MNIESASTQAITSIREVLLENPKFPKEVCRAVRAGRAQKVWRGKRTQRVEKFKAFVALLNGAMGCKVSIRFEEDGNNETSLKSLVNFEGANPEIVMVGKLSLATLLYCFATAQAQDDPNMQTHFGRWRWAANVFKRFFPKSFSKLDTSGAYLLEQGKPI